ncbi:uncharacterized protein [Phyllobates terribilis]|uniref:uncharacterized protein n=1 Tax=Phyllobates terribilis TaxID=111132 RepID=UPI003CCB5483
METTTPPTTTLSTTISLSEASPLEIPPSEPKPKQAKKNTHSWTRFRAREMGSHSKKVLPKTVEKRSREVGDGELEYADYSAFPGPRRSIRRRLMLELENCGPSIAAEEDEEADSSPELASCCSSHGSVQLVEDRSGIADPTLWIAVFSYFFLLISPLMSSVSVLMEILPHTFVTISYPVSKLHRREAIMDSVVEVRTLRDSNSRFKPAVKEMPSKVEIDDFLSAAENDVQKRFTEKYNFDAVNGVPLKGRYEWVRIKP